MIKSLAGQSSAYCEVVQEPWVPSRQDFSMAAVCVLYVNLSLPPFFPGSSVFGASHGTWNKAFQNAASLPVCSRGGLLRMHKLQVKLRLGFMHVELDARPAGFLLAQAH